MWTPLIKIYIWAVGVHESLGECHINTCTSICLLLPNSIRPRRQNIKSDRRCKNKHRKWYYSWANSKWYFYSQKNCTISCLFIHNTQILICIMIVPSVVKQINIYNLLTYLLSLTCKKGAQSCHLPTPLRSCVYIKTKINGLYCVRVSVFYKDILLCKFGNMCLWRIIIVSLFNSMFSYTNSLPMTLYL